MTTANTNTNTNTPNSIDWGKTQINSLVIAKVTSIKPRMTAKLDKIHSDLLSKFNAEAKSVSAAHGKLFKTGKSSPMGRISNIMTNFVNELKRQGSLHEGYAGATVQHVDAVDAITLAYDEACQAIEVEKKIIRDNFDDYVAEGKDGLADIVDLEDLSWPTVDEFLGGYKFDLSWSAMTQPIEESVLAKAVGSEVAAKVRANSEKAQKRAVIEAAKEPIKDLVQDLQDCIEALTKGKRFRAERLEALVSGVEDLENKNWLGLDLGALTNTIRGLAVDPASIPDKESRAQHAKKVATAKKMAQNTLSDLGL